MVNLRSASVLIILICGFGCITQTGCDKSCMQLSDRIILNDCEKDKILFHYSEPEDSLKKKAATFLLDHIAAHYSSESSVLEKLNKKYAKIKSRKKYIESYEFFNSISQDITRYGDVIEFERFDDIQQISGGYIIDNIEEAFKVWENSLWSDSISFEIFCEYVLPYRVMDEPLDYDREFFREEYAPVVSKEKSLNAAFNNIMKMQPLMYHKSIDEEFPYLLGVGLSYKVGVGNCVQQAVSEAMILRSAGIPATVDYVPQWGNYPGNHFMTKLVDMKKKSIFEASLLSFKFTIPKDSLPEGISDIRYKRTIPKTYRMTWSAQPERLLLNSEGKNERTGLFRNLYEKDVTEEYTKCSTFSLQVEGDSVNNVAYLCVFGRNEWIPVCAAPIKDGVAIFENVGREVVYLPIVYDYRKDDYMQPVAAPFYFTDEGICVVLEAKGREKQRTKLHSKYPMFSYTAAHAYRMKGGRFQGANKPDFSDAKTLFTIEYYPFYKQEIKIVDNEKFRYFRYLPPPKILYSFSELQFYTLDEDNNSKRIEGTFFEEHKSKANFTPLTDNDLDTYVSGAPVKESWIGYDAGEDKGCRLTGITFSPQNDGNCIIPGYIYELSFWQGEDWKSLGKQKAMHNYLEYKNVPSDALLWLRCHTKGREERIFTYKNDKQIWW